MRSGEGILKRRWMSGFFSTMDCTSHPHTLNHASMGYHFHFTELSIGGLKFKGIEWCKLGAVCQKFQMSFMHESGIICENYVTTQGLFPNQFEGAWCVRCFIPHELDTFEVKLPKDLYGASLEEVGDSDQYMVAHPGDHLSCAFQCPNCQAQNIKGKNLKLHWMPFGLMIPSQWMVMFGN